MQQDANDAEILRQLDENRLEALAQSFERRAKEKFGEDTRCYWGKDGSGKF